MKKNFNVHENCVKVALVCALIYVLLVVGVCGLVSSAYAETYALTTVVVSLDYDADVVEVQDFNGNVWAFDGCEDWQLLDVCSMTMDDNDTEIIYDDAIINCRYDGWLDGWMERVCE